MNRLEIILEVGGTRFYVDTQGMETIPLTYNIANIKDISTTNGSFSKSIIIPETPQNRAVFNNISDLNSSSQFNPNLRNRAYILVDSEMIIDGYFQLTDVSVDHDINKNTLTLVIFTDNNDFYTVLGDSYLEDLDLSRFDHIWDTAEITKSWTASHTNGFYYPLIDYGYDWAMTDINGSGGQVQSKDVFPAFYARVIWDQIFTESGFSWNSTSLTQSTPFDNLIIPFNGKTPGISEDFISGNIFRVGLNSTQNITNTVLFNYFTPTAYTQPTTTNNTWTHNPITTRVKFNNETSPNGDPNNLYNTTLWEYTNGVGYITQNFGFSLKISQLFYYAKDRIPKLQLKRSMNSSGVVVSGGVNIITNVSYPSTTYYPIDRTTSGINQTGFASSFGKKAEYDVYELQFNSQSYQFFPGEKVWLEYTYELGGGGQYDTTTTTPTPGGVFVSYNLLPGNVLVKFDVTSFMFNDVSASSAPLQLISMNTCIPKKIKQKDFVMSLIKMFNLVVEPNRVYPKTLNINTRDSYYTSGIIKDWSKKVDHNETIDIQILGETQNKRTTFKYKEDKDYFNVDYTTQTKLTYGEYQYVTDNEFVTGEKKVEIIFSPTPVASLLNTNVSAGTIYGQGASQSGIAIPRIGTVNNNIFQYSASNIRILQKKYMPNSVDLWKFNGTIYSSYPYSGHVNDPLNPTEDINFGQTIGMYYPQAVVTNNNLYNKYWHQMIEEISDIDSRIITCSLYLTASDIIDFKFNDNIYLDFGQGGQYYKVNKIEGYDPTTTKTCRVELIKTKNITVPRKATRSIRVLSNLPFLTGFAGSFKNNIILASQTNVVGSGNIVAAQNVMIVGATNSVSTQQVVISGSNNMVSSSNTNILGDNNIIDANSEYNTILGSNNTVNNSVTNSIVVGNGMTINQSNTFNISGILVINRNYISAGQDEILNPFSDNSPINYISSSRDGIRELGSYDNISIISGGRDTII